MLRKLKDGRQFWTEKNGFVFKVKDKKGNTTEVTEDYYKKCLALYRKKNKK